MKKPIFIKIFLGYLLVTLALAGLILVISSRTIRPHYLETSSNSLQKLGTALLPTLAPLIEQERHQELKSLVSRLGARLQTRLTIIDSAGAVLGDSWQNGTAFESHGNRPEVMSALEGKPGQSIRYSTTLKQDMLYVALPVETSGTNRVVVRLSVPLQDIDHLLDRLRQTIFESTSIFLLFSLVVALVFSLLLSTPIRKINSASKKVAAGDFKARVSLHNNDEIGQLAESFNDMTEKLGKTFTELSQRKEELEGIISSISEILLVLDQEGRIRLFNESAVKVSALENIQGRFYWEVIRSSDFSHLVSQAKTTPVSRDIQLGEKTYLCSATPVHSGTAKIVLLHDITERKQIEKIKKDLVVNVSHELRTPLTAIKGFTETLLDESDEKTREYLDIILKHTDRLINIVNDLLDLSELGERPDDLMAEDVDVVSLIRKVVVLFEQKARGKNLVLAVDEPPEPVFIHADQFRLEQALSNLIDNAVKYTEQGTITISAEKKEDSVTIKVHDTGIGIPREHLPRIFERFYVVDKSRSRMLGGTGLGLAIVKHIVMLHHGEITVSSAPQTGTTFTVTLPANPLP